MIWRSPSESFCWDVVEQEEEEVDVFDTEDSRVLGEDSSTEGEPMATKGRY